ncbi:MAG: FtsW/RodA/SpoVE family cell cycle protein [Actinobacteria bacterium]|nr:FtsW/RodA/SpoVE family cell cycle protein [Actinomycetota bacterium]
MITERGMLDLPTRNRELGLIGLAVVITTAGFAAVQLARAQEFSSSPIIAALLFAFAYFAAHIVVRVVLPDADPYVLPITAVLTAIGLIEIYRISPQLARDQGIWMLLGLALFVGVVIAFRDIRRLEELKYTCGAVAVGLLLLTITLGASVNGARLWIRVGGLQIQPGEFAKILLVIFLAGYLRERREVLAAPTRRFLGIGIPALRHALPLLLLCGISLVLLVAMNDLGTSLLFFVIALAMIYIATGRLLYVGAGLGVFALGALGAVQLTSHVQSRIEGWLDPWAVEQTSGYQIAQSIYTIADGGVLGAGFGRGLILNDTGGTIIPYAQTDFIYSVIANEMGLVGAIAVILLYLLLSWRGFRIATAADDGFSKLLAAGLATAVAFQVFVIVGGVIRLLPLTGLTLPFVSYGGSSVTANFAIAGLLLCISQRANRERPL